MRVAVFICNTSGSRRSRLETFCSANITSAWTVLAHFQDEQQRKAALLASGFLMAGDLICRLSNMWYLRQRMLWLPSAHFCFPLEEKKRLDEADRKAAVHVDSLHFASPSSTSWTFIEHLSLLSARLRRLSNGWKTTRKPRCGDDRTWAGLMYIHWLTDRKV